MTKCNGGISIGLVAAQQDAYWPAYNIAPAYHYGMFAFNTADPSVIDAAASAAPLQLVRAETKVAYRLAFG